MRRSREAGFDAHLVKPVDPDTLLRSARLGRALEVRGPAAVASERIHAQPPPKAFCAAATLAAWPPHARIAGSCSARAYENDSTHGPRAVDRFIASRFAVALSGDWPPDRKLIVGTAAGTFASQHAQRCGRDGRRVRRRPALVARQHHARLQHHRRRGAPDGDAAPRTPRAARRR